METIHAAVHRRIKADFGGIPTSYIKKVKDQPEVEAELQQGVFNDVNEIGTSKKRSKKRSRASTPQKK